MGHAGLNLGLVCGYLLSDSRGFPRRSNRYQKEQEVCNILLKGELWRKKGGVEGDVASATNDMQAPLAAFG